MINKTDYSDNLIKILSEKFYSSHETIANLLKTQQASKRLNLQYRLKKLCIERITINPEKKLNLLIADGVDLNFIMDCRDLQKTPLMITVKSNFIVFELLLKKNALINACNLHGYTALNIATEYPINKDYLKTLLKNPALMINQRNNYGETALLHCLINREHNPITVIFLNTIKKLLDAGADPEQTNNHAYTPLEAAKKLENPTTIDLIEKAIEKKHIQQ